MNKKYLLLAIFGIASSVSACKSIPAGEIDSVQNTPQVAMPTAIPEPVFDFPSTDGQLAYASERDGKWQIMLVNADGSREVKLTEGYEAFSYPSWSPDGDRLVMRIDTMNPGGIAIMSIVENETKFLGQPPQPISSAFDDAPHWSSDGSKIIYAGLDRQLFLSYEVASGITSTIPGVPANSRDPKLSPNGLTVVFSLDIDNNGKSEIFTINLDGTNLQQLTQNDYFDGYPGWSPDGKRIVFSSKRAENSDLYIMDADGKNVTRLTYSDGDDFDPSWSPDGTRIAFTKNLRNFYDGLYEIFVIKADGTGEMRLTYNDSTDRWPAWRPNAVNTGQGECLSAATLITDLSVPVGTRFANSANFTKMWYLENSGSCTWTPSDFRLHYVSGDLLGDTVVVPIPGAIQPGDRVKLNIDLQAPEEHGIYSNAWSLYDDKGTPIPDANGAPLILPVIIEVLEPNNTHLPASLFYLDDGQIWKMGASADLSQAVTSEPLGVDGYDVSHITGNIAYISENRLFISDVNEPTFSFLAAGTDEHHISSPLWSPDGKYLAYAMEGIHIYDTENNTDRLLTANSTDRSPSEFAHYTPRSWSPDGKTIEVDIGYWESGGMGLVSFDTGEVLAEYASSPMTSWSPNSSMLYQAHAIDMGMLITYPGLTSLPNPPVEDVSYLLSDQPVWGPVATASEEVLYFSSKIKTNDPTLIMPISLSSLMANDLAQQKLIRENLFWTSSYSFREVLWSGDASQVLIRKVNSLEETREVLLFDVIDQPPLFITDRGSQFKWGP